MISMDFNEVIQKRKSVRSYHPDLPDDEILTSILDSARHAPSWSNKQCWHFIIIKDPQIIQEVAKTSIINRWIKQAPVLIVACADPHLSEIHHKIEYYTVDVAIAMEHLVLAATDRGLGTCWIGAFHEEKIKTILQIPPRIRIIALSPLGYPQDKKVQILFRTRKRKSLSEISHYDHW
jgi:nitroreductase